MAFLKRHSFLLGLAAGTVVVVLGIGLIFQVGYRSKSGALEKRLNWALGQVRTLNQGKIYTDKAVKEMAKRVEEVQNQRQALLGYLASMGAARKPLVSEIFPTSVKMDLFHMFKAAYRTKLQEFMPRLNAFNPTAPPEETAAQAEARKKAMQKATLFAHPNLSFVRPDWLDKPEAPRLEDCRIAQEDFWLMEDLVGVIARINAESSPGRTPTAKTAAIKELVEIRIGAQYATLKGVTMPVQSGRYLVRKTGAGTRAETVSGRFSDEGFYRVLPWRLIVVARADLSGELVRHLRNTESFLALGGLRVVPLTAASRGSYPGLLAERADYGEEAVVVMEIIGESLVFQLKGGRVTTLPGEIRDQSETVGAAPGPAAPKKG